MDDNDNQREPRNRDLEIALVKIARALFDYTASQEDHDSLGRLDSQFDAFQQTANDYHNRTGGLHPDLGLELTEWAAFKSELLASDHPQRVAAGKSGIDRAFVDGYGKTPELIITELEHELGISS
jgi:hypothetical protein